MASSSEHGARRRARSATGSAASTRAPARRSSACSLVTLLVALPLSLALRGMIEAHLGASLAADSRRGRHQLRLVAGVLGAGDRPRHDVRAVDHRVRRRARQPERLARQPAAGRRRSPASTGGVAGALVVPVRRCPRSLRARPADARRAGSLPRAARTSGGSSRLGLLALAGLRRAVRVAPPLAVRRRSTRG